MALDVVPAEVIVVLDVADDNIVELEATETVDEGFEVLETLMLVAAVILDDAVIELEDETT